MKTIFEYLVKDHIKKENGFPGLKKLNFEESDNDIANKIINVLAEYKIKWSVKKVNSAIKDVTDANWWKKSFDSKTYQNADYIFNMACLNDGTSLKKNSQYNCAEIVYHGNNTDVQWFIFVTGKHCEVWYNEHGNYGSPNKVKKIEEFDI